jgi:hypothetical protein
MPKLNSVPLLALLLVFAGQIGTDARSAELEGALQYPPRPIGDDAQPPPPARMAPPLVSPWWIEMGVSGSSMPSGGQRFFIRPVGWTCSPASDWKRRGLAASIGRMRTTAVGAVASVRLNNSDSRGDGRSGSGGGMTRAGAPAL